ncbi:MAG: DUF4301 family protein [Syntrophaceae bacterium]|nr:DUF4301 family protein [Syntrophaceae bacterium]
MIPSNFFTQEDLKVMMAKGIDLQEVLRQLEIFHHGTKPIRLIRPAHPGDGIVQLSPEERPRMVTLHDQAAEKGRMLKFVPASGVASRMFKDWYGWYQRGGFDSDESRCKFLEDISRFAFYDDLREAMASEGKDAEQYIREGRDRDLLEFILTPRGLNYAWLPKAFLKFHLYAERSRTALEEHLVEAALYIRDEKNICRIHFTVSEEHESRFKELIGRISDDYEKRLGVKYEMTVTVQHASTDTIAVDMENKPFRERSGKIVFRPGGHGALLKNLNAIEGDIIFIKNIDNVVPDRLKDITVLHKKILGGYLVQLQEKVFHHLNVLAKRQVDDEQLSQVIRFCQEELMIVFPNGFRNDTLSAQKEYVFHLLNRPIRVCGMVKNEGEPGGGPFWVEEDGIPSLQIVEENQLDLSSREQQDIWQSSTHFNPVDLVCGVKNYLGEKFNLNAYVNLDAVFISKKSHEEGELKALEHPGLWNGSMAFWNTVFVEVPLETFNPVKTIDDLLRKSHLP